MRRLSFLCLIALFSPVRVLASEAKRPSRAVNKITPSQTHGKIVFSRLAERGWHVFSMNGDGSKQTLLIKNLGAKQDYSFRRDGRAVVLAGTGGKVAFASAREMTNDVFVMSLDSVKPVRIYNKLFAYSPAFSYDGKSIVFSAGIHDEHTHQFAIWKMKPDGSKVTRVNGTSNPKFFSHGAYDQTPSFTPDTQKIVFSSGTHIQENNDAAYGLRMTKEDFYRHIYIMNADGTDRKQLTDTPPNNYDPSVSPDGKRIVFVSERDGNPEIYVMNVDGTAQKRLTQNPGNDFQPTWSPDGKMIAWVSDFGVKAGATYSHNPNNEICVMAADGTGQERLTRNSYDDRKPQWLKAVPIWKLHRNLTYVPTQMESPRKPSKRK